ncbi:MAG: UPF0182 family protein [Calothrix sp. MO_167.B12]|nr:UPF0182 family protein [Calothrix sp. MO_167.B12]
MKRWFWNRILRAFALLLGCWLLFDLASHLIGEIFWFAEVGYLSEYLWRLVTQFGLWAIAFLTSIGFLFANLAIAHRFQYPHQPQGIWYEKEKKSKNYRRIPHSPNFLVSNASRSVATTHPHRPSTHTTIDLPFLLPIVIVLSLMVAGAVVYNSFQVISFWYPSLQLPNTSWELSSLLQSFWQLWQEQPVTIPLTKLGALLVLTSAIIINYQFCLRAIAVFVSLLFAFLLSARWDQILQYFNSTSFHRPEPLFNQDISIYVFSLPVWEILASWFLGLFFLGITAVAIIYLRSANSLSEGRFPGFSVPQRLHLNALAGLLMLAVGMLYWLLRYELLYSTKGVNYGASYIAVKVQLPIYTGLSLLALAIAVYLVLRMIFLSRITKSKFKPLPIPRQLVYLLVIYVLVAAVSGEILPTIVHHLIVQPNELLREGPFIQRTIALTREAFNLEKIEARTFNPQGKLTADDLEKNHLTIDNIRLWDTRPLLETNRQLQQIRPYYEFPDADIDRYTLKSDISSPETEKQQTIVAARELDYGDVPDQAQTWINKHLIYTHGYGFTLSPVNTVARGGLPYYYVKDIGSDITDQSGSLQISDPAIRASIPIGHPRIYYGEISNTYVMTGTRTKELDYPSGAENVYNVYDGQGGIAIGSFWRRLLFAEYLKDWQMLLTRNFTPQTKLLFRRNIRERVQAIAPFLRYDKDPYLVVAQGDGVNTKGDSTYLYWILDAYTTSDRYPYSDPGKNKFNYIRNSVKVVIDAYNGTVKFYVADPYDPIINTFEKIFPKLFQPLESLPISLGTHIRYPVDLFSIQSERLLTYHMTDPQVFYNREDLWKIPTEIYGGKSRPVEPYYLIMKLPTAQSEEFVLLLPFTPVQRINLIAWLAARSDGREYGKLLLYEFPKQELVYGIQQIEALINQDPEISQRISLWNREGSRVIQGNLLVIPIEQSLLYVEPLYLEAEQNSLPTLARVIVAYDNRIIMANSLNQALEAIFKPETPSQPVIVSPVQ